MAHDMIFVLVLADLNWSARRQHLLILWCILDWHTPGLDEHSHTIGHERLQLGCVDESTIFCGT